MSKTIELAGDLDDLVQSHLTQSGGGDLGEYVNTAVKRQLFWDTVHAVQERNAHVDPEVLEREVQEAVDAVRADRS